MPTADDFLYRINTQVLPDDYKPTRCVVLHPQPAGDVLNFNRRPGGVQGYITAILTWEDMPAAARTWFDNFLSSSAMSVVLTDIVLPDSHPSATTVTQGGLDYTQHGEWTSAELWRVQLADGVTEDYKIVNGTRTRYLIGNCTIRIVNIGA